MSFNLWRRLSDDRERLTPLEEHFLLPAFPERRGHARPYRATERGTSILWRQKEEGASGKLEPEPLLGFPQGRQGRARETV